MGTNAEVVRAFQSALSKCRNQFLAGSGCEKSRRKIGGNEFPSSPNEVVLEVIHLDHGRSQTMATGRSPREGVQCGVKAADRSSACIHVLAAELRGQAPGALPVEFRNVDFRK